MTFMNIRKDIMLHGYPDEEDRHYVETVFDILLMMIHVLTMYLISSPDSSNEMILIGLAIFVLDFIGSVRQLETCDHPSNLLDNALSATNLCGCVKSYLVVCSFIVSLWGLVVFRKHSFNY
ncbi:hypothetical protein DFJ63DRAFT_314850 [Scheffersomyces coipomensis]|uniref:uncharacterized protein n=1 Tax=Scheffersomyces coipomensis TaxID=1788519 RepID=UPI00315CBE15